MSSVNVKTKSGFRINAWQGDAKTLLAFNLNQKQTANLAGFTIEYQAEGLPYFNADDLHCVDREIFGC